MNALFQKPTSILLATYTRKTNNRSHRGGEHSENFYSECLPPPGMYKRIASRQFNAIELLKIAYHTTYDNFILSTQSFVKETIYLRILTSFFFLMITKDVCHPFVI